MSSIVTLNGWNGGNVYYASDEELLYVRKNEYNGKYFLVCHDTVMNKKDKNKNEKKCPGRCHYNSITGECVITTKHNHSTKHKIEYNDLVSLNAMKDMCRYLAANLPGSAHKISVKEIFLMEMAK